MASLDSVWRRLRAPGGRTGAVASLALVAAALAGAVFVLFVTPATVSVDTALLVFLLCAIAAARLGGILIGLAATAAGLVLGLLLGPEQGFSGVGDAALFAALGAVAASAGQATRSAVLKHRAADRVLADREAHLQSIFDTAPEAMIVIDQQGAIQAYGASAERMFGWRAEEALGRSISMLMPQPYRDQHAAYVTRYLATGEKRIIGLGRVVLGQRKDGSTFPMDLTVSEVATAGGRFFTGFVRDLTERETREARLRELQAEVVHISRVSAMGEMASSLAHELNQPLSAIANYLNGARRLLDRTGTPEPRIADAIERASEQAVRAGDIIRRLREFLTRREGQRTVESIAKLVHEACRLALLGVSESGLTVRYALDPRLDRAMVDRIQVQQVIVNLVRNALDSMGDQPERVLDVSTKLEDDMAVVSVADNGPGLDPAAAERLFQPFVTTKENGMGVGLSISRTIVEAHGGRIWTEANPGGGVIFRFTLRLAPADEAVASAP